MKGERKNMEEIFKVHVVLDEVISVDGRNAQATMILFHGTFSGPCGEGRILPGGVDTQIQKNGEIRTLSARYILEGTDEAGKTYRLFVENNGICPPDQPIVTTPVIYTDYEPLQWLEEAELTGTVEPDGENRVMITVYGRKK